MKYDFAAIEPKWQKKWAEEKTFHCESHSDKPKFYGLVEFPYPSGQGLHVGHTRPYTAMDVVARKRRMDGYNVLFPMGYLAQRFLLNFLSVYEQDTEHFFSHH